MSKPLGILFEYYKGILDEDGLEERKKSLRDVGIVLVERDKSNKLMAFMDEFTNQVSLVISNPLFIAYILGLLTSASYDVMKSTIVWIWNSVQGKQITKFRMGGKQEEKEATFGIQVRVDANTKIDFRLSGDVSDELKSKCIDRAFGMMNKVQKGKEHRPIDWFAHYSWDEDEWVFVNVIEEINKRLMSKEKSGN